MKENDIDNLFRETFRHAEESPRADLWQNIEKELVASAEPIKLSKKKSIWYSIAAAAVLLLAFGVGLKLMQQTNDIEVKSTSEALMVNLPPVSTQDQEEKNKVQTVDKTQTSLQQDNNHNIIVANKTKRNTEVPSQDQFEEERIVSTIEYQLEGESLEITNFSPLRTLELQIHQVTEIEDIKPLIEPEEEMESMLASTDNQAENKNVVTTILNTITDKITINEKNSISFSADDEGSFKINIINSIAKNRNKKRR